ncbi:tRNA threonylcarbamoyladenosine biosynthesis protein TsaB [Oxobacter pfennigii]|uniref:tRNA threonylcarbamoyladenosine biosynthesis protein TsaB n=1 Tax=Oxobacter pfennigii TaxID=36849 RepID=A0A0N8NT22_9CLOT|nr:tRNA (adenosine(37)-N6)-threonylcarbamoyltransferase complex dimerization subunit type 1 TsaB [Oxobacter pfennigii]KPU43624.1 tRNA threonylcarbamoyladenosine biosynthesis protein TsaB [Oxobacter pfennigii]
MRVLAIDTSSMVASVAVADENKLIGEITYNYKKQHSTIIMPMIDDLLKSIELDIKDMDAIACASGPGSFTGLRIGAATVKGLCQGANKPLIAIPTLDALVYNLPHSKGIICPIMDALRDNVYTCIYKWEGDEFKKLSDYMAIHMDELFSMLKEYHEKIIFLGDGIFVHKEKIQLELREKPVFAPPHLNMQKASSIAALALKRLNNNDTDDYITFAPFYLRQSQAEREYDKASRGE